MILSNNKASEPSEVILPVKSSKKKNAVSQIIFLITSFSTVSADILNIFVSFMIHVFIFIKVQKTTDFSQKSWYQQNQKC